MNSLTTAHPNGHFYYPVVNPADLKNEIGRLWPPTPPQVVGIDFNDPYHHKVLRDFFPEYLAGFESYPENGPPDESLEGFYVRNSQFSWLDARALFVLLRAWEPRRIIEVGSGYSTLLMSDVNARFLDGKAHITAVEPFPRPFLNKLGGSVDLLQSQVQSVPIELFSELTSGDILFIDSSHVAKTGSDVNHLYFEVIPRLVPGVRVHVHDIFLPTEYPREWVLEQNRSWNEQYLLRAMLMDSTRFRVLFGSMYAYLMHPDLVSQALGIDRQRVYGGGSFWFEVTQT